MSIFKKIYYQAKHALQRVFRGYDDTWNTNLRDNLCKIIPKVLEYQRYNRRGSPCIDIGFCDDDTCHKVWDNILDEIIYHLKESNDETCSRKNVYQEFYDKYISNGINNNSLSQEPIESEKVLINLYLKENNRILQYQHDELIKAFMLIAKHINELWD